MEELLQLWSSQSSVSWNFLATVSFGMLERYNEEVFGDSGYVFSPCKKQDAFKWQMRWLLFLSRHRDRALFILLPPSDSTNIREIILCVFCLPSKLLLFGRQMQTHTHAEKIAHHSGKEKLGSIYGHNSVLTSPAINCPKPGGNVRDAITKVMTPGYTRRLKQEKKVRSMLVSEREL